MLTHAQPTLCSPQPAGAERMHIVVTGHVDHGKSTIVGRLLAETGSVPAEKLETIRLACERSGKRFEHAFLLDALKDEQAQGITIDAARVFFKSRRRHYIILDAPGHEEFLKNMVTGASRAEAALLVIDAFEGLRENSRRHGFMLSMLGISQIAVLINKMDLVDYSQEVFERLVDECQRQLPRIGVTPMWFIPVSGSRGENLAAAAPSLHALPKKGAGRRSGTSRRGPLRTLGTSAINRRSSGTSTRRILRQVLTCGFILCWTGPS
jgi:bifunctional enzyme CysN/CysC